MMNQPTITKEDWQLAQQEIERLKDELKQAQINLSIQQKMLEEDTAEHNALWHLELLLKTCGFVVEQDYLGHYLLRGEQIFRPEVR